MNYKKNILKTTKKKKGNNSEMFNLKNKSRNLKLSSNLNKEKIEKNL